MQIPRAGDLVRVRRSRWRVVDVRDYGSRQVVRLRGAAPPHARLGRRVLVLTPAGLRDQWSGELSRRFSVQAASVDGPLLRRLATALPVGVNPWLTVPIAIASVDYVKRPEVLPAVRACSWELVVVDEA